VRSRGRTSQHRQDTCGRVVPRHILHRGTASGGTGSSAASQLPHHAESSVERFTDTPDAERRLVRVDALELLNGDDLIPSSIGTRVGEWTTVAPLCGSEGSSPTRRTTAGASTRFASQPAPAYLRQTVVRFSRRWCTETAVVGLLMSEAVVGAGQARTDHPSFEVVSVRANTSGSLGGFRGLKGRTYTATNQALRSVIADAYGLPVARVLGGPEWIGAASVDVRFIGGERYDLVATLPETAGRADLSAMLRLMLAERFGLAARIEMRDAPIYTLLLARADGRLGEQLRPVSIDCEAEEVGADVVSSAIADRQRQCATEIGGTLVGRGQRVSSLARMLSLFADRPVVDRTGLSGGFDFDLSFPELATPADRRGGGPGSDSGGAIFAAVREQLGLRLEPARGPLEFLVIDAVTRPTPN
jgi:uncharacterized protein (TIGR03435 family)